MWTQNAFEQVGKVDEPTVFRVTSSTYVLTIIIPEEGHVINVRNVGYWLKNGVILLFVTLNNKHHIGSKLAIITEKNLLVNFTIFIKKFIILLVTLGHTQNLGFLLF